MRCAREHFRASEPVRASDNASSMRIPCPALACHTPSNTRPALTATLPTYPEPPVTKAPLASFTRAVELVYDVAETFRTI
eukprot:12630751-Alexandrium_andersonii.AAC.1